MIQNPFQRSKSNLKLAHQCRDFLYLRNLSRRNHQTTQISRNHFNLFVQLLSESGKGLVQSRVVRILHGFCVLAVQLHIG